MTKEQYINALKKGLKNYPSNFQKDILEAFEEHFQSGLEAGHSEEEVMLSLGTIEEVLQNIKEMDDTPVTLVDLKPSHDESSDDDDDDDDDKDNDKEKRKSYHFEFDSDDFSDSMESIGKAMESLVKSEIVRELKESFKHLENVKPPKPPKHPKHFKFTMHDEFDEEEDDDEIIHGPISLDGITKIVVDVPKTSCDIEVFPADSGDFIFKQGRGIFSSTAPKLSTSIDGDTFRFEVITTGNMNIMSQSSKLTLLLPVDVANLDISVTSGDIEITGITLENLNINNTSGDISLRSLNTSYTIVKSTSGDIDAVSVNGENISIETTSGDLDVDGIQAETLELHSISGDVSIRNVVSDDFRTSSTSGDVEVSGVLRSSFISSVSGDIDVVIEEDLEHSEISTTSGDVDVEISDNEDICIYVKTMSGDIRNRTGLVSTKESKHSARIGEGENQIDIKTLSGDVVIR